MSRVHEPIVLKSHVAERVRFELTLLLHTTRFPSEPLQPLEYLSILATDGGVDPHAPLGTLSVFKTGLRAAAIHPPFDK